MKNQLEGVFNPLYLMAGAIIILPRLFKPQRMMRGTAWASTRMVLSTTEANRLLSFRTIPKWQFHSLYQLRTMEYFGTIIHLQKRGMCGRFIRFHPFSFFQKGVSQDGLRLLMLMINSRHRR